MLKIIAGERRGANLFSLDGLSTRPLRGRVRESLFNIIQFEIAGRRALDLFAGSGAVGLEALSRGALHATFVEDSADAQKIIRRNIAKLKYEDKTEVLSGKLPAMLDRYKPANPFDLVFIMPPYNSGLPVPVLTGLLRQGLIGAKSLVVLEIEAREPFVLDETNWQLRDDRTYGITRLLFLHRR